MKLAISIRKKPFRPKTMVWRKKFLIQKNSPDDWVTGEFNDFFCKFG